MKLEPIELGLILQVAKGKKPARQSEKCEEGFLPYVDIQAFEQGAVSQYTDGEKCLPCEDGDILIVCDGARSGLVGRAIKGYVGSTLAVLKARGVCNSYLFLFIAGKYALLNTKMKGTGTPHLNMDVLKKQKIIVPSIEEQERIVSKIEELFSEIDNAISSLKTARRKIAAYRQAIYASSFAANHKHAPLSSLIEKPRYGTAKKCTSEKSDGSTIVYRIPNISYTSGHVDTSKIKYAHFSETEINKIDLRTNDLLFIRSNGSLSLVGRTAIITPQDINATFAGYLIRLRLREPSRIAAKFLHYYLESPSARSFIEDKAKSTNGINNISATEILKMPVPLYDTNAASQIVAKIDNCLSIIEQSERCIDKAMHAAEVLKQSILKKAFEGELS